MATIDNKAFIDDIIANNGWHHSTIESPEDYNAPDNPRVALIVEYENFTGKTTWGVTFAYERNPERYLCATEYVRNPRVIWRAEDHPLNTTE